MNLFSRLLAFYIILLCLPDTFLFTLWVCAGVVAGNFCLWGLPRNIFLWKSVIITGRKKLNVRYMSLRCRRRNKNSAIKPLINPKVYPVYTCS